MSVAAEISVLKTLTVRQLREKYLELFGEPTKSGNKDYLFRKLAWKVQEKAYGGLSERALRRAAELADESAIRIRPPRGFGQGLAEALPKKSVAPDVAVTVDWDPRLPMAGTILTKDYKGREIQVLIRGAREFEVEGRVYGSLTAIAKEVSGTNYNGWAFFGLTKKERA
jgi:hypothetical protein